MAYHSFFPFWLCILHGSAFCSVAYFRFSYANGAVRCAFVTAKTRVAPKKPFSIPTLKLQAADLSARLSSVVVKEHDYKVDFTYLATGSSTVFQWIRGESKRHPAFIANRVVRFCTQLNQASGIIALVLLTHPTMVAEDFQSHLSYQRVDS